ncbi:MAG TPA: CAP domain-containing protein [Solirubrobacteraceae bacterium]|nr:CAP domain-containing protein [Solirubrobacteraceae bacterium]
MTATFRTLIVALVAAALLASTGAMAEGKRKHHRHHHRAPAPAKFTQDCPDADLEPTSDNQGRIRDAILCLHNQIRAEQGLPRLRENKRLRKAAAGHSRHMVNQRFFEHTTPSGQTMVDRILKARYVREDEGWMLGENLAWGTGSYATPRGAVQAWMESPGHRANILKRGYREMGVGLVLGVPVSNAAGATYTVDFGVRR